MIGKLIALTLTAMLMCPSVVMAEPEEVFFPEDTELILDRDAAGDEVIYAGDVAVSSGEEVFDGVTEGDDAEMTYDGTDPVSVSTWGDLQTALNNGGEIVLNNDISAISSDNTLTVPTGKTVTLDLNGHVINAGAIGGGIKTRSVITVVGTLNIKDSEPANEHTPAVFYNDPIAGNSITVTGGIITGGNGTVLSDKTVGGGVYVNGGTLTINGGSIACNTIKSDDKNGYGGGVYVDKGGTFTINGGSIVGNTSDIRGGGVYVYKGTLVMTGGTITGNKNIHANTPRHGIMGDGGGVYMLGDNEGSTSFTMTGGMIDRNAAEHGGGVYVNNGCFNMEEGTIKENKTLLNIEIKWLNVQAGLLNPEFANSGRGAGVHVANSATFIMGANAEITGNTAEGSGGGVHVCTGDHKEDEPSFIMNGGKIAGNISQSTDNGNGGGAVSLAGAKTIFEMKGGIIGGDDPGDANRAESNGGGVFMREQASFKMTGGKITGNIIGNNAVGNGGGVCVGISEDKTKGRFTVSGSVNITGNEKNGKTDNVFLRYGKNSEDKPVNAVIDVNGELSDTTKIGVNVQDGHNRTITKGYKAAGNTEEPFTHFFGNNGNAVVWNSDDTEAFLMDHGTVVHFEKGAGNISGTMNDVSVPIGTKYTLPVCGFSSSEKKFKEWSVAIGKAKAVTKAPNDKITVTADTIVTAVWIDLEKVAAPVFSPAGGSFDKAQSVKITCATTGAKIYYTTNGKTPTTGSTLYNGAISVSKTTTIKAIAVKSGMINSAVSSAAYTIRTDIKNANITLSKKTFTYNGKEQKPTITKITVGGKTLNKDDYSVTWPGSSTKAGTYTVTITGKGKYKGTVTAKFKIEKAKNTLKVTAKKGSYNAKVADLKKKAKSISGDKIYQFTNKKKIKGAVTYKLSAAKKGKKSFKNSFSVDKKNGKLTIKKGLKKGTYNIEVKVTADGDKNHNKATKKVVFSVKVK